MHINDTERLYERFIGIIFMFSLQAIVICLVGIVLTGCDRPYLPWNAGTRWDFSGHERPAVVEEGPEVPQRHTEDFCRDNRETVENYRRWLASEEPWSPSPSLDARRRQYAQQFVDQYDSECN